MQRVLIFLYGTIAYAIFFVTILYAIGFVGNLVVPRAIDGVATMPLGRALLINAGLLGLFAVQHSVMARRWFKEWWKNLVPTPAERSTYVLFSSVALLALFRFWQPLGGEIWNVTSPIGKGVLLGIFGLGWGLVFLSTFLINHFDLFGLRQVYLHLRGRKYSPLRFGTPALYQSVRHPLYLGLLMGFWATPTMTWSHLVFAVATTAYVFIGIQLEERDLMAEHPEYGQYRRRVPMILPSLRGVRPRAGY